MENALHAAVRNNDIKDIKDQLKKGAGINDKNADGDTPLHLAVKLENERIATLLLDSGANCNAKNNNRETPVHLAVKSGALIILNLLSGAGADINATDSNGDTPIHLAIKSKNEFILTLLLNCGVEVGSKDKGENTPLHLAVLVNSVNIVKLLINAGAEPNAAGEKGLTPLHRAVEFGNIDILRLLIDAGADVNVKDHCNDTPVTSVSVKSTNFIFASHELNNRHLCRYTPLHVAVEVGDAEAAKLLIKAKADVNLLDSNGETALHYAVKSMNERITMLLLDAGVSYDCLDFSGNTPLHYAAGGSNSNIFNLFLKNCSHSDALNRKGYTPLFYAVESNNTGFVKRLIEAGAELECPIWKIMETKTALHVAAKCGHLNVSKLLLDAGANAEALDFSNWNTPLHYAAERGGADLTDLLVSRANVNQRNEEGFTPLHIAAEHENVAVLKYLIGAGADVRVQNKTMRTPLHSAAEKGNVDAFNLLINAGADIHAIDNNRDSVFSAALVSGNKTIVQFFLNSGINVNKIITNGHTPISHAALNSKKLGVLKQLMSHGANINQIVGICRTPFTLFIERIFGKIRRIGNEINHNHQNLNNVKIETDSIVANMKFLIESVDVNLMHPPGERDKEINVLAGSISLIHKRSNLTFIWKVVVEHIAKLQSLDSPIDPSLLEFILENTECEEHFTNCMEELKRAKKTKIRDSWVTFFNLLTNKGLKFVKYAANETLISDFEERVVEFPIYGETMKSNIERGIDRRKFYDRASISLSDILPIFSPTHLIIRNTLDALKNEDWEKLCIHSEK